MITYFKFILGRLWIFGTVTSLDMVVMRRIYKDSECHVDLYVYAISMPAVLRLRGSINHMRGYFFTNARKIYYPLLVLIARFLNYFYRYSGHLTANVHMIVISGFG